MKRRRKRRGIGRKRKKRSTKRRVGLTLTRRRTTRRRRRRRTTSRRSSRRSFPTFVAISNPRRRRRRTTHRRTRRYRRNPRHRYRRRSRRNPAFIGRTTVRGWGANLVSLGSGWVATAYLHERIVGRYMPQTVWGRFASRVLSTMAAGYLSSWIFRSAQLSQWFVGGGLFNALYGLVAESQSSWGFQLPGIYAPPAPAATAPPSVESGTPVTPLPAATPQEQSQQQLSYMALAYPTPNRLQTLW